MKIFFNYTGSQQLARWSTLLQQETVGGGEVVADIGLDTRRLALLDALVDVSDGCLRYTIFYNRYMTHQENIRSWVGECQRALEALVSDK